MQNPNDLNKLSVLVVEDNRGAQIVIKHMLNEMPEIGFAHVVANGIEALEARDKTPNDFDVFFIDIGLPDIPGTRAAQMVRDFEAKHNLDAIPICALTAHNNEKTRQECLGAGMNAFVSKPATIESLRGALRLMGLINEEGSDNKAASPSE